MYFSNPGTYLLNVTAVVQAASSATVFANLSFSTVFEQQQEVWVGESGTDGELGGENGFEYSWSDLTVTTAPQYSSLAPKSAGFTLAAPVNLTQLVSIANDGPYSGGPNGYYRLLLNNTSNVSGVTIVNPMLSVIQLD